MPRATRLSRKALQCTSASESAQETPSTRGMRGVAVGRHQLTQLGLGDLDVGCVPDAPKLLTDGLFDDEVGSVMEGVLGQVELAALPSGETGPWARSAT